MPIDVSCPNCGAPGQVPDDRAGKDVGCYQCGKVYPAIASFPVAVDVDAAISAPRRPRSAGARPAREPWIYGFLDVLAYLLTCSPIS